jgi:hypothetical protein
MERIEFYNSRLKLIWLFFLNCLMVAGCYFCTTFDEITTKIIGWFGIAFFGLAFFVIPIRLFRTRRPEIVIERRGVEVLSWNCGLIAWQEIRRVSVSNINGNRFLSLELADKENFYARFDSAHRTAAKWSQAAGFSDASIGFTGMRPSIDEAVRFITRVAPEKLI